MLITIVVGARPNFVKIAPIIHQITRKKKQGIDIDYRLVHSGQHYDWRLSAIFFDQLCIPKPHVNLQIGPGTQAEQTGWIMMAFEKEMIENPTDYVLVVGDVTTTMATAIVAKKLGTRVIHLEAGIRSFDLNMPEEINRIVTDAIADYFYVTSEIALKNLRKKGVSNESIVLVGNTMIDTLIANLDKLQRPPIFDLLRLVDKKYIVLTLHRPANVDQECKLKSLLEAIVTSSRGLPIVFTVHPRTKMILNKLKIQHKNLHLVDPMGYLEFNYLVKNSICVITDSGGITEETTYMKIPCITLRENTERPETVSIGTNELVGTNPNAIWGAMERIHHNNWKKGGIPAFWDGKTSERIVSHILSL